MTTTFPANPLGIKVELLLNAIWTDISAYVLEGSDLHITGMGRPDWTNTIQAAQITMTLKNTDGRFSPKNTAGAYYPYIARNVQIRVSVDSKSATGVFSGLPLDANPFFETNVTNWTAANSATIAQSTTQAHTGTGSMSIHGNGTVASPQAGSEKDTVMPLRSYTATAWYYNPSVWASGVITQINWYDGSNNFISNNFTALGSLPAATWT